MGLFSVLQTFYAAMPTVDKLIQGAKQLKVKEVPAYVGKFAGEHWTPDQTRSRLSNWLQRYKVQVGRILI